MSTIPVMVKQITIRAPIAPPNIAPRFNGSCSERVGIGPDVEDMNEEFTTEVELDAGTEVVSTTVAVGREAGLVKELPGTEV